MIFMEMLCIFKQKTAYEMRISDWSSDVCSYDLAADAASGATMLATLDSDSPGAPFSAGEQAGLEYAGKLALTPAAITAADIEAMRSAGPIGIASSREEWVSTCRSRWSPIH